MKILVTGAKGQVGTAASDAFEKAGHDVARVTHAELDIASREAVLNAVVSLQPHVIVNGAAMTNVDACETQTTLAFAVNSLGVRNLVEAARLVDAHLIHISTDFVFDGNISRPYTEYDETNPLSEYGLSKLGGDTEALRYEKSTVLRVSWVYGLPGKDFFSWVVNGVRDGAITALIDDQIGTCVYSADVARVISYCASHHLYGLFNVANAGITTRLEMGQAALDLLGIDTQLGGITAESLARPAGRPNYSPLDCSLLTSTTGIVMRDWREALEEHSKDFSGLSS